MPLFKAAGLFCQTWRGAPFLNAHTRAVYWEPADEGSVFPTSLSDPAERLPLRRTFKDTVFTNLFSNEKYTLQLYKDLHPEDPDVDIDDIEIVTIQNVLTSDQHNDLGFVVGDRMLILVEAQSTWSPNIVLRALLYAAQTLKDYIKRQDIDLYGRVPARIPRPELYVVYTGEKDDVPDELTLSGVHFGGAPSGIETRVRVIKTPDCSMAGQYIDFVKTMDSYRVAVGPNEDAVLRAIADCTQRGILVEYLKSHEKEVVGIMMTLYDEEEVLRTHLASERRIACAEGRAEGRAEGLAEGRAEGVVQGMAEGQAKGIVAMCKEFGLGVSETVAKLCDKLGVSRGEAEALIQRYW